MDNVFLKKIRIQSLKEKIHPYDTNLFAGGDLELKFQKAVTIISGPNGSGKSTLLKAIAESIGFSKSGGSTQHHISDRSNIFDGNLKLSWLPKVTNGFFFRADKISDYSAYFDDIAYSGDASVYSGLGDRSLEFQSHGQAVKHLISKYASQYNKKSIVILDEPETSLSIESQIELVSLIHDLSKLKTQFIIATHSPIILGAPNADIFEINEKGIAQTNIEKTQSFLLMRQFIKEGKSFFDYLQ
jgi:predicted ATPase